MSVPAGDAKAAERWVVKTQLEELQGAERLPGPERDTIEARPNKREASTICCLARLGSQGLLHHFDRDAAGEENHAAIGGSPGPGQRICELVERIVTTDVFAQRNNTVAFAPESAR
jgi:hypothetical protein